MTDTPDFEQLAGMVRAPERFAEIYDPLAQRHGGHSFIVVPFLVPGVEGWNEFAIAFSQAHKKGWLSELIRSLAEQGVLARTGVNSFYSYQDQAILQPENGMPLVAESRVGLAHASSRVCLISIRGDDGNTWGSGFLVGPQTVLTAYHVIKPLLHAPDYTEPIPNSAKNITITFGYLKKGLGQEEQVAENWLVAYSQQHETESKGEMPFALTDGLDEFKNRLDFAAIRLARPVGRERGYYNIAESRLPRDNETVVVIQHPSSNPMRHADGTAGKLWPATIKTRLPHNANTIPGSSGGIVLDEAYRPLGLHQGCVKLNGSAVANVAIPTRQIATLDLPLTKTEGVDQIWRIEATGAPVFGRSRLQNLVHTAIVGDLRVLVVTGRSQVGKSFSAEILRQRVLHSGDIVITESARTLPLDPIELGTSWLRLAGASPSQCMELPRGSDADSALPAWLRDHFVPAFMRELEQVLDGKRIWFVLDDLDKATLPPGGTALFVEHLLQRMSIQNKIRFMLIGEIDVGNVPRIILAQDEIDSVTPQEVRAAARLELVASRGYADNEMVNLIADAVMAPGINGDLKKMIQMYRTLIRSHLGNVS